MTQTTKTEVHHADRVVVPSIEGRALPIVDFGDLPSVTEYDEALARYVNLQIGLVSLGEVREESPA